MTWFLQTVIGSHYTSRIWSTIANQTESQIFYLSHAIFLKLVNRTKQDLVQHYICFDDFLLALHLIIVDFCFVKYSQCIYWLVCYIYSRYIYLYKILCFFTFLPKCTSVLNTTYYVIKFVSDLRQVDGFLQVLRFPPLIKLNAMI
jgi:hypothetical protein